MIPRDPSPQRLVLAMDAATEHLALALADASGRLLGSRATHLARDHAARLPAELDALFASVGCQLADVAWVCVGTGPGSYTGIRIAVAFARGLGRALGATVAGASTLIAVGGPHLAAGESGVALLDARRGNVYAQPLAREIAREHHIIPRVRPLAASVKLPREAVADAFPGLRQLPEGQPDAAFLCVHATEGGPLSALYL